MERLQKILAAAGIGSRRQCEQLILQGRVSVDGQIIRTLGSKADPGTQKICCDGELVRIEKKCCYLFYKPRHCLCTNAPSNQSRVIDFFASVSARLFTIGRLENESEGVLLVTNDGDLAQKLVHPKYRILKVYRITVRGRMTPTQTETLRQGLWTGSGKIRPEHVHVIKSTEGSTVLEISFFEGRNLEIHRLFTKLGHPVSHIMRIQFGPFKLENLKPGQYRMISEEELQQIFEKK